MQIRHANTGAMVGVKDAIVGSLDGSSYDGGQLEDMRSTLELATAAIGAIVERLYEKDVLSDADIVGLLSWRYAARPDDAK